MTEITSIAQRDSGTSSGSILAFDLARPGETSYLVGSVSIIVGACPAAVFGTVAAVRPDGRMFPLVALGALVSIPLVGWYVVQSNPGSGATDDDISTADRASALEIEIIDYDFAVDPTLLQPGQVVRLRNTGTLPHDFTIAELDITAYVPPGRDTYLRLPSSTAETFDVVCTVGDHADLAMRLDVAEPA